MSAITKLRRSVGIYGSTDGLDRSVFIAGVVGATCLVGAFIGFLARSNLTAVLLIGFVLIVGYGWYAHQARTAKGLSFLATVSTVVTMALIIAFIVREALPVFELMGLDLVTKTGDELWNTSSNVYSLVPAMWGTLIETVLAMAIAGPLGVADAVFIAEIAPGWLREIVKPGVEILAGVPSIVYGFVGFVIINSYLLENLELSGLGSLFAVGLVVGIMALPTVVSVAEDALTSVPESMKGGSLALGTTDWQTTTSITIPAAFSGVSAAVLLGVGRAVGETMAATVILGNVVEFPSPLYDVFGDSVTLTSLIASQYGNASGLHLQALFAAGIVSFITVLVLSVGSQFVERRMQRKLGGKE